MEIKKPISRILYLTLLYLGILIGVSYLYNPFGAEEQEPSSKTPFVYQNF